MFLACGSCRLVQLPELITRRPIPLRVSVHYKPHSSCLRCTAARGGNPYSPPALCFRLSPRASDLDGIPPGWVEISPASHRHRLGGRGFRFLCYAERPAWWRENAFASADLYFRRKFNKILFSRPKSRQTSPQSPAKFPDPRPPRPAPAPDSPRLFPTLRPLPPF